MSVMSEQGETSRKPRVVALRTGNNLRQAVRDALEQSGLLSRVSPATRVVLKPNLTYPYHKPGVTTSPALLKAVVEILRERTAHLAVVETDGGYGAWKAEDAFQGHGLHDLHDELGVEIVNLCEEPREMIRFKSGWRMQELPLPTRLLHETDLFITLPVPKIHCMTGLTLSYKNQWGCVPDIMRLRRHYIFDDAIVAINRALKTTVLADGTFFLNRNGPMEGDPVRMDLVIASDDPGAFDRYVSELMGFSWRKVPHLRRAFALGALPEKLEDIDFNVSPASLCTRTFYLKRTWRNWIALMGFKSRWITWLGYESWFGRVVLHAILYALAGRPVKPKPD